MKALLLGSILLGLGACASQPPADSKAASRQCQSETGTRIDKLKAKCDNAPLITRRGVDRKGDTSVSDVFR
jgi:hypothetical protein